MVEPIIEIETRQKGTKTMKITGKANRITVSANGKRAGA